MDSFYLLVVIIAVVLLIQYNCDKVFAFVECESNKLLNWSVQSTSIEDLFATIKKGIFALQIWLLFIDLLGLVGFIRAINTGSYQFVICILWVNLTTNIVDKSIGSLIDPIYKKYYSLFVTVLKTIISLYFDNELNVFSNACKLLCLLFADALLAKAKYILLKFGFCALTDEDINENSVQSIITNIGFTMTNKLESLVNNYSGFQLFKNLCYFTCEQIIEKTEEISKKTTEFVRDVNNNSRHLYKLKLALSFIVFCFLHFGVRTHVPHYVLWSLIIKVLEITFGATTIIDKAMDDAFYAFNSKCLKIKSIGVGMKASLMLISFGVKKIIYTC